MDAMMQWEYNGHALRTVPGPDDEMWWVADDVCRTLTIGNASLAVNGRPDRPDSGLDEDEKAEIDIVNVSSNGTEQRRKTLIINESGLYKLTLASRKPEAKAFKKWVTSVVLPAIRKTGRYDGTADGQALLRVLESMQSQIKAQGEIIVQLQTQVATQQAEMIRLAAPIDVVMAKPTTVIPPGYYRIGQWKDLHSIYVPDLSHQGKVLKEISDKSNTLPIWGKSARDRQPGWYHHRNNSRKWMAGYFAKNPAVRQRFLKIRIDTRIGSRHDE